MCKVGMEGTGDTATTGRGRIQGVKNVQQGGGAGNTTIWVGDVGPFGGNGEEGGKDSHSVPLTDHGEGSAAVRGQDIGDTRVEQQF